MFLPQEIIRKKRDNKVLTKAEIEWFIHNIVNNNIIDAQISAFAMAIYFNKLTKEELTNLTISMRDSGVTINWDHLDKPVVDKHSTGGVGDLTSLVIAPLVASCGCYVPMIAGRGLGHTGGTLDKLNAIPGYNTTPGIDKFKNIVKTIGCAITGQTNDLAPADKKMYAIRDISATTESIDLITSSILSKKLAGGLHFLVMDIKTGNGAFLSDMKESVDLAKNIVSIGNAACCKTAALITDMNQPLANNIGNALEIIEVIKYLKGDFSNVRLHEVILALSSTMLHISKIAASLEEARKKLINSLQSGKALELFAKMIVSLGAPKDFIDNYNKYLPKASIIQPVYSLVAGRVSSINTRNLGLALIYLGGGRLKNNDKIDYSVGLTQVVKIGEHITKDTPLAIIHANRVDSFNRVANLIIQSINIDQNYIETNQKTVYQYIY